MTLNTAATDSTTTPPADDQIARRSMPGDPIRRARLVSFLLWAGPLILTALFLLPARAAAIRGDDEWTFELRGVMELQHVTLWHEIWSSVRQSVEDGRPNVVGALIGNPVLYLFDHHPTEYHLYLVLVTVICGAVLWSLVRRLSGSAALAAVTVVVLAACLQFRFYHDALLGYYGGPQIAVALLLASLLAFLNALERRSRGWAWSLLAAVLFGCAGSIEQWIPPLLIIPICLVLVEWRTRRGALLAVPMVAMGLGLILLGYLGSNGSLSGQTVGAGYNAALNIGHIARSLVIAWVPPLPTSNRLFTQLPPSGFYGNSTPYPLGGSLTPAEWLGAAWRGVAVLLVIGAFTVRSCRWGLLTVSPPRATVRLLAIGIPLWLVSPLLVVVAQKYQVEGSLTRGYLETVAQAVGVAMVAGAILIWLGPLATRRGGRMAIAVGSAAAVALGFAAAVDGFNNIRIVGLEQPVRHTRDLLETAAQRGVLAFVPQHSTLFFSGVDMDWHTGVWGIVADTGEATLYADSGRDDDVRPDADQVPLNCAGGTVFPPPECAPPLASSAWVRVRTFRGGGTVIVAQMGRVNATSYATAPARQLIVYTEQSGSRVPAPPVLSALRANGSAWSSSALHLTRVRSGGGWAIYTARVSSQAAPTAQTFTDPRSLVNFEAPPGPDQMVREFGTKQLLP